jgi:hypothetical protein
VTSVLTKRLLRREAWVEVARAAPGSPALRPRPW